MQRSGLIRSIIILGVGYIAACSQDAPVQVATPLVAESAITLTSQIRETTRTVDGARITAADSEPQNWLAHGRTYSEQRFSPLTSINKASVQQLSLAWSWDTDTTRGLEATPIVVDGVMFSTGTWSNVYAHDAASGELIWRHDPKVPKEWAYHACCDIVNRGVAVWQGKVFVGTLDGRLQALDAATGELVWEQMTTDPERPYTITGAPRVFRNKVVIGNGGAELGVRGYVTAYDTQTGEQVWRFYTVPGNPDEPFEHPELETAAKTWSGGNWWEVGGGGTAWDSIVYDAELNQLYIGTGNGSPWSRHTRSPGGGDNLYLSSILALNPDTGRMIWYYQTTPGDNWDYTAVQPMMLADLKIEGQLRKVLMQAPKNGFFYVLDRETGELISAETYVPITWATHVDRESGRPVENPGAHYADSPKTVHPGPAGGHNWHPMSFSPITNLVYLPIVENRMVYGQEEEFKYDRRTWNTAVDFSHNADLTDDFREVTRLIAWDPVTASRRWQVDHDRPGAAGVLSTAGGLVFQPGADCTFSAYDAESGAKLWGTTTQMGAIAAPISYEVNGEQYVAFMSGWGGAVGLYTSVPCTDGKRARSGRILAYKIGGQASLPPAENPAPIPQPPPKVADQGMIELGETLYARHCGFCHSLGAGEPGVIPNLTRATEKTHAEFMDIVRGGRRLDKGMISFAQLLGEDEVRAIQAYVIEQAHEAMQIRNQAEPAG